MLPRRQPSASRARSPHAAPGVVTVRRAIICSLASVFLLGAYVNLTFLRSHSPSSSVAPLAHKHAHAHANKNQQQQLANALTFETRAVKHVVFTSGCREIDVVHSDVLAHSLRATGFAHNVSHVVYGCAVPEFEALQRKKNPHNRVDHVGYPVVNPPSPTTRLFGDDKLTTTLHAGVLRQWLAQELNRNRLRDDDFIMLVDSDAVFTKLPEIWNLYREVDDIQDPRWFGQDAAWYWPKRSPLPDDELRAVLPAASPALEITEWREYAVTAPYVVEVALLREVLPTVEHMWHKLSHTKKHLAFALAAAHHGVPFGISGALSVHDYPSRYENWDFVDDIKYNPCNETPRAEDLGLLSFPISLRAENFTLQTWIDGREWSMFHAQLPTDLLHCDAWLLKEPSGYLWHLASTTKGYERVPTILRRRHTMSVCLAVRAYNQALIGYKKALCPRGYNVNKQIPMEFQGTTWSTALAYGGVQTGATVVEYGNSAKLPTSQQITGTLHAGQARSDDVHVVYVTGCSAEHQWQSDLLAQSFVDAKQRGRLTRVVTGCSDEQLTDVLKRSRLYPHLSLFATKSYATKPTEDTKPSDVYEGYNKPFGLRDWLRGANPPVLETAVVIVNGDFVLSTPLTFNSGHRVTTAKDADSKNYKQHSHVIEGFRVYKPFFVYQGEREVSQVTDAVVSGVGIAQRWRGSVGLEAMVSTICPGCPTVTAQEVHESYSPGTPTVLTRQDLAKLIDDYCAMTVTTRRMDPTSSIAENVGLTVAAIKHQVKFNAFDNIVITGDRPGDKASGDFWGFLQFTEKNPCDEATDEPMLLLDGPRMLAGAGVYKAKDDKSGVAWVYDQALVPSNVFSCDAWLLATPPKTLWLDARKDRNKEAMRQVYGVCTSLKLLNRAVVAHRERACVDGFNHQKKLRLVAPRPQSHLKVGAVDSRWDQAMAV